MVDAGAAAGTLSAPLMRVLAGARVPRFLATRNPEGIPNVVPLLSIEAADEGTLVFAELMIWKTRRNLEADGRLSVLVLSPDLRAWTVRGRFVEFQRSGPHYDRILAGQNVRYNAYGGVRSAGLIEVLGVTRATAFSQRALLLDTMRARFLAWRLDGQPPPVMRPQVEEKFGRLKAAKAVTVLDAGGHPDCLPAMPLVAAGPGRLLLGGPAAVEVAACEPGTPVAAAVLTMEPVAYQVKGVFASSRGRFALIDVAEAYSASPPLPGERLPAPAPRSS